MRSQRAESERGLRAECFLARAPAGVSTETLGDPCLIIDTVTILPGTKNPTMTFTRAIYFQSSSDPKCDLKSESTTC